MPCSKSFDVSGGHPIDCALYGDIDLILVIDAVDTGNAFKGAVCEVPGEAGNLLFTLIGHRNKLTIPTHKPVDCVRRSLVGTFHDQIAGRLLCKGRQVTRYPCLGLPSVDELPNLAGHPLYVQNRVIDNHGRYAGAPVVGLLGGNHVGRGEGGIGSRRGEIPLVLSCSDKEGLLGDHPVDFATRITC